MCPSCQRPGSRATHLWPLSVRAGLRCPFRAPIVLMNGGHVCARCYAEVTARLGELQDAR